MASWRLNRAAARRATSNPSALLILWCGQVSFFLVGLLALRSALNASWAHRPSPDLFQLVALASREPSHLVPLIWVGAALLLLYALAAPLLHGLASRKLVARHSVVPPFRGVFTHLLLVGAMAGLAKLALALTFFLAWPALDVLVSHLANDILQAALVLFAAALGAGLWAITSFAERHALVALAMGAASEPRAALITTATAHARFGGAMWSAWFFERCLFASAIAVTLCLHIPPLPVSLPLALTIEALVLLRLWARTWGLGAAVVALERLA